MRRVPHNIKKDPKYFDKSGELKQGYTYHPVNEGYQQVSSIKTQKRTGGGKDGTNWKITGQKNIYKEGPSPQAAPTPAPAPAPAPAPPPPPKDKSLAVEPVQHSLEIKQAKERVKSYEGNIRSGNTSEEIYKQAQANVQSSFIKPPSLSNMSQQYDFDSKSFNAFKPTESNEQAQAAQNQLQNYVSKYS